MGANTSCCIYIWENTAIMFTAELNSGVEIAAWLFPSHNFLTESFPLCVITEQRTTVVPFDTLYSREVSQWSLHSYTAQSDCSQLVELRKQRSNFLLKCSFAKCQCEYDNCYICTLLNTYSKSHTFIDACVYWSGQRHTHWRFPISFLQHISVFVFFFQQQWAKTAEHYQHCQRKWT